MYYGSRPKAKRLPGLGFQLNTPSFVSVFAIAIILNLLILTTPAWAALSLDEMHVIGTVTGTSKKSDYALISHRDNEPKTYRVGDPILPGITLHKIFDDRIQAISKTGIIEIKLGTPFAADIPDYPAVVSPPQDLFTINDDANSDSLSSENIQQSPLLSDIQLESAGGENSTQSDPDISPATPDIAAPDIEIPE